jgi:hypothetical protein
MIIKKLLNNQKNQKNQNKIDFLTISKINLY